MTTYLRLLPEQLPEIAEWIANLNKQNTHHIGFCGTDASALLNDFQEDFIQDELTTLVGQFEQDQLVGLIGFDCDDETAEVWGPFHLNHSVSDSVALWQFARNEFSELQTFLFFLHAENTAQQQVMSEIHADFRGKHLYYVRPRDGFDSSRDSLTYVFQDADQEALLKMHSTEFPDTYYDTQTLINRSTSPDHLLLMAKLDGASVGYAYVEKAPDEHSAHLEYLAIAPAFRGQGLGYRWLSAVLAEVFTDERVQHVTLTVSTDNEAANPLYEKVGFQKENELWFYKLGQ
ncbi:GNAT family N-acetyltransferase [Chryseomicrobium palamuruense]|uniref:GNAT family N-acetyltransferase n=1 Tax=Chryseomicrobium palamuruense TaxID=682973 RepID=A0ABV8UZ74_9BACL